MTRNTATWTSDADHALRTFLSNPKTLLSPEFGSPDKPCSIGALNLALTGKPSHRIPDCVHEMIGDWIRFIQPAIPPHILNSPDWYSALLLAANSAPKPGFKPYVYLLNLFHNDKRINVLNDWLWTDILPLLQPFATRYDFASEWQSMLAHKKRSKAVTAFTHLKNTYVDLIASAYPHTVRPSTVPSAAVRSTIPKYPFDIPTLLAISDADERHTAALLSASTHANNVRIHSSNITKSPYSIYTSDYARAAIAAANHLACLAIANDSDSSAAFATAWQHLAPATVLKRLSLA